jgi:hypothetical protein
LKTKAKKKKKKKLNGYRPKKLRIGPKKFIGYGHKSKNRAKIFFREDQMTKVKAKLNIFFIFFSYNFFYFFSIFWGGPWPIPVPPPSVIEFIGICFQAFMNWVFLFSGRSEENPITYLICRCRIRKIKIKLGLDNRPFLTGRKKSTFSIGKHQTLYSTMFCNFIIFLFL